MSEPTGTWRVMRNGTKDLTRWRCLYDGHSEAAAREVYEQERLRMRQGGVELRRPDGKLELISTAPFLRTRW